MTKVSQRDRAEGKHVISPDPISSTKGSAAPGPSPHVLDVGVPWMRRQTHRYHLHHNAEVIRTERSSKPSGTVRFHHGLGHSEGTWE